jgi:hypothetical protein
LHYEWTTYRLELLSDRFRLHAQEMRRKFAERVEPEKSQWVEPIVDVDGFGNWMVEQIDYLKVILIH